MMPDQAGEFTLLPPVTTRFGGTTGLPMTDDGRIIEPVVGEPTRRQSVEETAPAAAEPAKEPDIPWQEPVPAAGPTAEADFPWEEPAIEGTAEPAFEADVEETEAALAAISSAARDEFPLDAFIIPEHTQRLPTGLEGQPIATHPLHTPVTDLADRLEKLSHRLRVENAEAVLGRLASGDKLDAMLAGLLAGFLAGRQ